MRDEESCILPFISTLAGICFPVSAAEAGSYAYTDPANRNSFTVDTDWIQKEHASDPMYKVIFTHTQDPGTDTSYGSNGVWSQLSSQELRATPQIGYEHTMYTSKEITDYLSVRERFVQTVNIGRNTYFLAEVVSSSFILFEVRTTHFVHICNDWLYPYSLNGNHYDRGCSDFRKLVSSRVFPTTDPILSTETVLSETTPSATTPIETAPSATTPKEAAPPTATPIETVLPTTAPPETNALKMMFVDRQKPPTNGRIIRKPGICPVRSPHIWAAAITLACCVSETMAALLALVAYTVSRRH